MRITINLTSNNQKFALKQTNSLQNYLAKTCNPNDIQQARTPLNENHAGGLLESILYITLNSATLITVAKALHTWLKTRAAVIEAEKQELTLSIEFDSNKKITLNSKNLENVDSIIEQLKPLIK